MLVPVVVVAVVVLLHQQTVAALNLVNITAGQQPPSKIPILSLAGGTQVADDVVDLISSACIFPEDNLFLRRLAFVESRDGTNPSTYRLLDRTGIWGVTEAMFRATQGNTPALRVKYEAIRRAFGIDWMSLTWHDIQVPLYNGLAAALYTVVQGIVPADTEQQGTYIQAHYDSRKTAYVYNLDVSRVPICSANDNQTIDVVFLLDANTNPTDFSRMREFLSQVVSGLAGHIRVSVYQFAGSNLEKNLGLADYPDIQQMARVVQGLQQINYGHGSSDTGTNLQSVISHAWTGVSSPPVAAKLVVLITDRAATSSSNMVAAGQTATTNGVSVMTIGVGPHADFQQLDSVATVPKCRHHLSVGSFQDIKFYIQLLQRTICHEPMIARGMFHCRFDQCRNVAFPIVSPTTTLITNVTCDNGHVYTTTRMPTPNYGFSDFTSLVESRTGPQYVTFADDVGKFIYAHFFPTPNSNPNCVVTLSTVNGLVELPPQCEEWQYPEVNPCLTATRQQEKFPYYRDHGMFLQCDLQNQMYLTKCPPGSPYYIADCEVCAAGPGLLSCTESVPHTTPYCGLDSNPCTQENILQDHLYFACPVNETMYLQCNIWGHSFVRSCPEHQVWRQHDIACVYHNTDYNPCGSIPGERYYPNPLDSHSFIDCGGNNVPNVIPCSLANLVWNQVAHTCDYQHGTTLAPLPHQTIQVYPFTTTVSPGGLPIYDPVSGRLLGDKYAPPCTLVNVQSNLLFHPYPGHPTQYIQCDLWGDAYIKDCQSGYSYDPYSHTCVDGPVHVDGSITG